MRKKPSIKGELTTKIGVIKPGMKIPVTYAGHSSYIKYMAICEGYIMARWKGAIPFVDDVKGFLDRINTYGILTH